SRTRRSSTWRRGRRCRGFARRAAGERSRSGCSLVSACCAAAVATRGWSSEPRITARTPPTRSRPAAAGRGGGRFSAGARRGLGVETVRALLDGVRGTATLADGLEAARRELELREEELDRAVYAFGDLDDVAAARDRLRELREARDAARERVADLEAAAVPAL